MVLSHHDDSVESALDTSSADDTNGFISAINDGCVLDPFDMTSTDKSSVAFLKSFDVASTWWL